MTIEQKKDRVQEIEGTLSAIRQGWISGYSITEIRDLQSERYSLVLEIRQHHRDTANLNSIPDCGQQNPLVSS